MRWSQGDLAPRWLSQRPATPPWSAQVMLVDPPLVASYHHEVVPDDATCLRDYRRLVKVQAEGVDLLICETMTLTREALAATRAAVERQVPLWVAFSVDVADGTRLRSDEPGLLPGGYSSMP